MEYIKGINFAPFPRRGLLSSPQAEGSFEEMCRLTGCNTVILTPAGVQKNAFSEVIDWQGSHTPDDEELEALIRKAHQKGLRVFLKPTVNCLDGTWRAHIGFFEKDVPCEPKWPNWFANYTAFQLHYAKLAQRTGCEMFIAGCEMVKTEHRQEDWRKVVASIRSAYEGPVSYNTDKYQEEQVGWWDAVDVISSSGYYPIDDWQRQLDRIETVVERHKKPFFFAETGCMSITGSQYVPNDWELNGTWNEEEQAQWYRVMFEACAGRSWVEGMALWDWPAELAQPAPYSIYNKPAQQVVREYYGRR